MKIVTCCMTCYYVTDIPYVASFYCCKNWVDLDYRNLGLLHVLGPVFLPVELGYHIDTIMYTSPGQNIHKKGKLNACISPKLSFASGFKTVN